ncbi:glycosyltransferase [Pseudanabaena sp. UWO311]|uniref:glycosyltransferase family 2 protein n=1 Tax=Pseudanabaena sp. UWO311 TaxID=2487337 RepID=UPI00115BA8C1|nr:glycosyltransferase [Pseudanabaena sp. UWO311]TYQ26992.1 glycosyltransferase [Pseudanabaena sp. UWO311]
MPKVTVLMPVYNAADYIKESIDSILNQTFDDFEFLIFNDGSTDNSGHIVRSYDDERIRFYDSNQNKGYVYHLNHGIEIAKGEYIARMDADDISLPKRFEKQVSFMDINPNVGVCGTWFKIIGSGDEIRHPLDNNSIRLSLLNHCAIGHPTVMLRACLLKESGLRYEPSFVPAEDYFFWVAMSKYCELANLPEFLLEYRIHQNQISNYRRKEQVEKSQQLRRHQIEEMLTRAFTDIELNYYSLLFDETVDTTYINVENILMFIYLLRDSNQKRCIYEANGFDKWLSDALIRILNGRESKLLNQLQSDLQQSETKLLQAQELISAIKSSKFWRLRQIWLIIKSFFRIHQ